MATVLQDILRSTLGSGISIEACVALSCAVLVFIGLVMRALVLQGLHPEIPGADAVVHDIPQFFRGRSVKNELFWARTWTLIIAVLASLFALYSGEGLVALLGAFGWGAFAAALAPTVAIGFNWKRATATAANVAILSSLAINFSIQVFGLRAPFGIDGGAFSLLVSLTLFFGISLLSKPPQLAPDVAAVMDM